MKHHIVVPPDFVRTIVDPSPSAEKTLYVLVSARNLPSTFELGPDPRVPKPTSPVFKRIKESMKSEDGRFHLLNRGITISARSVEYDNKLDRLTIDLPDGDPHYGIIDGGHTYFSILEAVGELGDDESDETALDQYVRLEIMIGVEEALIDIAQARNFSINVKTFSLENKKGSFQWLMDALGPQASSKVKFSENDEQPVIVLDVLQILTCLNPIRFSENDHPIEAYKNAAKCLEWSLDKTDKFGYKKLAPVALDACKLYDYIRLRWAELYNAPDETGKRGKFGKTVEANKRKRNRSRLTAYHFLAKNGKYPIEKGFAFPVLAGFRALLREEDDGLLYWTTDPFQFFDDHGKRLISTVRTASENRNGDPHMVGRDESVYAAVYSEVRRWWLEDELTKRQAPQPKMPL